MKLIFSLCFLLISKSYCQVKYDYIVKQPVTIDNPKGESYRFIVEKLSSDSAWIMHQYNMRDTLMAVGTYKDKELTIPEGKFKYYKCDRLDDSIVFNFSKHKFDTIEVYSKNYLETIGYYLNGEKTGQWLTYNISGSLKITQTYEHDKLNGPYKNDGIKQSGNLKEGKREGEWLLQSGNTSGIFVFKNDKLIKSPILPKTHTIQLSGGNPGYDIVSLINNKISKIRSDSPFVKTVAYSFELDKHGNLTNPQIIKSSEAMIDNAIIDVMLKAPRWMPMLSDDKTIERLRTIQFVITVFENKSIKISRYRNFIY